MARDHMPIVEKRIVLKSHSAARFPPRSFWDPYADNWLQRLAATYSSSRIKSALDFAWVVHLHSRRHSWVSGFSWGAGCLVIKLFLSNLSFFWLLRKAGLAGTLIKFRLSNVDDVTPAGRHDPPNCCHEGVHSGKSPRDQSATFTMDSSSNHRMNLDF